MKHHDRIHHKTTVIIRHTGQVGTVEAVQNSPYVRLLKVAGQWYRPSQLIRADDPEWRRQ
ncbi:hypothetical protein [Pseudactinotalea sp. Z1732]|uniref:hypothetical protein n=1 Tax=Micrococcales TaxID=85006 RepID=UPI003C7A78E0